MRRCCGAIRREDGGRSDVLLALHGRPPSLVAVMAELLAGGEEVDDLSDPAALLAEPDTAWRKALPIGPPASLEIGLASLALPQVEEPHAEADKGRQPDGPQKEQPNQDANEQVDALAEVIQRLGNYGIGQAHAHFRGQTVVSYRRATEFPRVIMEAAAKR